MDVERIIDEIQQLEEMFEVRTVDHSAQPTSPPRIAGTMKCWRIARGFGFGSGMACAADLSLLNSA
jgi:hypothetical protein